jgi:hypothetical protein
MDIIGEAASGEVYVIAQTGGKEAADLVGDLRREVESGRTRWFAVVGAGVEAPDLEAARERAGIHLDRAMCGCEHGEHFGEGTLTVHDYRDAPAGKQAARDVGRVCDACATTHMADYLL